MKGCEVCPFLTNQSATNEVVLLRTDSWSVALDRNQPYLGKSFVTLREHKLTLSDLSSKDWDELHDVIQRMEYAIKKAFGADVINWECLMNNAIKAGQSTHVHWHLFPRYLNGVSFAGENFPDPKWPRHLESAKHKVSDETYGRIAAAIKENLHGN